MSFDALVRLQARILGDLLVTRVLLVGFVWIQYGAFAGVMTFIVWAVTARLLMTKFYDDMMEQIQENARGPGEDPPHHDGGHTP